MLCHALLHQCCMCETFASSLIMLTKTSVCSFCTVMPSKWQVMRLYLWISMTGRMFNSSVLISPSSRLEFCFSSSILRGAVLCFRWNPDAIVFDSSQMYGTPSYWMQHFFRESNGATLLNSSLRSNPSSSLIASAITWKDTDDKTYLRIKVCYFPVYLQGRID